MQLTLSMCDIRKVVKRVDVQLVRTQSDPQMESMQCRLTLTWCFTWELVEMSKGRGCQSLWIFTFESPKSGSRARLVHGPTTSACQDSPLSAQSEGLATRCRVWDCI